MMQDIDSVHVRVILGSYVVNGPGGRQILLYGPPGNPIALLQPAA
jgi:hypothetical protein